MTLRYNTKTNILEPPTPAHDVLPFDMKPLEIASHIHPCQCIMDFVSMNAVLELLTDTHVKTKLSACTHVFTPTQQYVRGRFWLHVLSHSLTICAQLLRILCKQDNLSDAHLSGNASIELETVFFLGTSLEHCPWKLELLQHCSLDGINNLKPSTSQIHHHSARQVAFQQICGLVDSRSYGLCSQNLSLSVDPLILSVIWLLTLDCGQREETLHGGLWLAVLRPLALAFSSCRLSLGGHGRSPSSLIT